MSHSCLSCQASKWYSSLISLANRDVWKVDPNAAVQPAVLPAEIRKTPPEPPPSLKMIFPLLKQTLTRCTHSVKHPYSTCYPYHSLAAPPWFLWGKLSPLTWLKIGKRLPARWTTRRSPNHTRCSSASDVSSARAIGHQNGDGENTAVYSSALGKNRAPF